MAGPGSGTPNRPRLKPRETTAQEELEEMLQEADTDADGLLDVHAVATGFSLPVSRRAGLVQTLWPMGSRPKQGCNKTPSRRGMHEGALREPILKVLHVLREV